MKKILSLVLLAVVAVLLVGCQKDENNPPEETLSDKWRVVMITDVGTITDKSFNQGTYEGVKKFCEDNEISDFMYFRPGGATQADYEEAIDLVIANGYNVVVTPGFLFETAIYTSQYKYPEVHFILIDGEPHTPDYATYKTEENVVCILFKEEQSGFLAGYAAVAEGFTNLGFMGGMEVPAVRRFGIGYVAGAYYAAEALDKTITLDASRYEYLGNFNNDPAHTTKAEGWYSAGVEVIFAAAGGAGNAVMKAAENTSKKVIGVDVDQASQSETVISSAKKELAIAVQQELKALILDNAFKGGKTLVKGANEDAIGLPQGDSFKFATFTTAQYQDILTKVKNGTVVVPDTEAKLATFLSEKCGNPSVADLVAKTETEQA